MKKWPVYFKERLWVGDKDGDVGIATLWTSKEIIVEGLSSGTKKRVAVVGQLYSLRGGEYIFRNIWANPRHRARIDARASVCTFVAGFSPSSNLWYSFCRAGALFLMGIKYSIVSRESFPALIWVL